MPIAAPELQAFAYGFPVALAHWAIAFAILVAAVAAYSLLNPHREMAQVQAGNAAAAVSLAGALITIALPLAAAISASVTWIEVALWGASVTVIMLLLIRVIDVTLRGLPERVAEGDAPAAWLLTSARVAASIVLAAAVSA